MPGTIRKPLTPSRWSTPLALAAAPLLAFGVAGAAQGSPILTETFGTTAANPTSNPFTTDNAWSYADSAGTTIGTGTDTNHSRLFNPAGAGSGENTVGWISALNGDRTFTQITTNGTFPSLPALTGGQQYQFTLTYYASAQTSTTNNVNAFVSFSAPGDTLSFVGGSNASSTQTLTDSDASASGIKTNFVALGGSGGYGNTNRNYTATWTSTDPLSGGSYALTLGRAADVAGASFVLYDNVALDVSVVPEPASAGLLGLGAFGLLLRRRRRTA